MPVPVHVENDLTNRSDVTVRMVSRSGARWLLGGAAPGADASFEFRTQGLTGSYALTAMTARGGTAPLMGTAPLVGSGLHQLAW